MKYKLNTLITLLLLTFVSQSSLMAQFDDLYYDPDRDTQYTQEEEYAVYEDEDYYEDGYADDSYYDDYDYATRISRFRRNGRFLPYYSSCYMMNGWNNFGFDPYYDRFYNPGTSIYISIGSGWNSWNRWNRWNRWNSWNRWDNWGSFGYSPWNSGWNSWGFNSWGFNSWNGGFGNNFYAINNYYGNNGFYGNNNSYYRYDRVSNPNGKYYGSRNARSGIASTQGRLQSSRTGDNYTSSKVTQRAVDQNRIVSNRNSKSYKKGDIASTTRSNRILDRQKANIDNSRDRNTYRGTTNSRTRTSNSINRTTRSSIDRGSSNRTINRNNTSTRNRSTINRSNTSRRTTTTTRRNNTPSNRSSINSSRSSSNRSSVNRSGSSSSSRNTTSSRSTTSRKRNN